MTVAASAETSANDYEEVPRLKARIQELEAELKMANSQSASVASCYDLGVQNMIYSVRTIDGVLAQASGVSVGSVASSGVASTAKGIGAAMAHASKLHEHEAVEPHAKVVIEAWGPFHQALFKLFRTVVVAAEPSWEPYASATADAMVGTAVICTVMGVLQFILAVFTVLCCSSGKKPRHQGPTKARMDKARK